MSRHVRPRLQLQAPAQVQVTRVRLQMWQRQRQRLAVPTVLLASRVPVLCVAAQCQQRTPQEVALLLESAVASDAAVCCVAALKGTLQAAAGVADY